MLAVQQVVQLALPYQRDLQQLLIGRLEVAEQEIAGRAFLRIDVLTDPPVTQFYGSEAVYCITPTTEEMARRAAKLSRVAPIAPWELPPVQALPDEHEGQDIDDEDPF